MIDLLGFWSTVSVYSGILLFPAALIGLYLLGVLVEKITEGDVKGHKVVYWKSYPKTLMVFGKSTLTEGWFIITIITSILAWTLTGVAIAIAHDLGDPKSLVDVVSEFSAAMSPFIGGFSIAAVLYVLTIYVGRKFWKVSKKVNKLCEKLKDDEA